MAPSLIANPVGLSFDGRIVQRELVDALARGQRVDVGGLALLLDFRLDLAGHLDAKVLVASEDGQVRGLDFDTVETETLREKGDGGTSDDVLGGRGHVVFSFEVIRLGLM